MKHYEIRNVVLLSATNAQKSCCKKEDVKLFKLWVAAKKDVLREVLDDAFLPAEIETKQDVFNFCEVTPATPKVQRALRLCEYENPSDYVTFEIVSWNKPFECTTVDNDFNKLLMQEFTVTCDITYKTVSVKDDDGHFKYNAKGKIMKTDAGCFNASNFFKITDLDLEDEETFDE